MILNAYSGEIDGSLAAGIWSADIGHEHAGEAIANFTEPKAVWINIGR